MPSRRVVIRFPRDLVDQPLVYRLVKDFDLQFNILKASVSPEKEGFIVMELWGADDSFEKGLEYLKKTGLTIEPLGQDVLLNPKTCVHCGVCVPLCPTDALRIDPKTKEVQFFQEDCIACEICVRACPYGAMEVHF